MTDLLSDEIPSFDEELKKLKKENSKLRLQLGLGKSLANELDKQKKISEESRSIALAAEEKSSKLLELHE